MEATQGQMDGFFGQLPYKCHFTSRWHLWEINFRVALSSTPGWFSFGANTSCPVSMYYTKRVLN